MSVDDLHPGPSTETADPGRGGNEFDAGALGNLPWLSHRQARLASRLARLELDLPGRVPLSVLSEPLGTSLEGGSPEILWRAAGLTRTGAVFQFVWTRLSTRIGIGLDTPLAHAFVDRLLGFDRANEEGRLQLSPVEWGVLTFVAADSLHKFAARSGPLGPWDLTLDRVSADPFDTSGLGRVVTVRWPLTIGETDGSLRLWLPEALVARWLSSSPQPPAEKSPEFLSHAAELTAVWRAQAGTIRLPRGLKTLKVGSVLPMIDSSLGGTPPNPKGSVELVLATSDHDGRFIITGEPVSYSGGGQLTVTAPLRHENTPREPIAVTTTTPNPDTQGAPALDVPVTLVVELGRVNVTLSRLADLKPGDVVELGRHSREPIELTSGGRLVARGELVQIDTELGVRVLQVFL